jgi:hypothetical protein
MSIYDIQTFGASIKSNDTFLLFQYLDSSTRNNDLENEYEKIKMNQLQTDTTNYESYKRGNNS